jgi:hypothetical protein
VVTHLSGYQDRDSEVVDYRMWQLPGTDLWFRGPARRDLVAGEYVAFVGAAQTFGCLCEQPFPALLEERLHRPCLNLGYGGAGPAFFLSRPELLSYVNAAGLVVIQVMSGRSADNSLFESGGLEFLTRRADGVQLGATRAWEEVIGRKPIWVPLSAPQLIERAAGKINRLLARPLVSRLVKETLANYERDFTRLLAAIEPPIILFWFSRRKPRYQRRYDSLAGLFGEFPQLVDERTLHRLRTPRVQYVECVTHRGTPHVLRSRFTGAPVTIDPARDRPDLGGTLIGADSYYPSPEMHADAAAALFPAAFAITAPPAPVAAPRRSAASKP